MKTFKSGTQINQGYYKSFQPNSINYQLIVEDMEVLALLSQADRQIGRLDMYSEHIPNVDLFISMHVLKEATQSSKIEGTQTNIEEALMDKEDVPEEKRNDWIEIQNYIQAMREAIKELDTIPFSSRLIRHTHKVLMQGVRGEHKLPGEFRTSQNWIGGSTINNAVFIPPVYNTIPELMSDLEHFVHSDSIMLPDLLKIALIHYQFETIHPFLDGNGRVGRLLITLYLVDKKILKRPILYLSDFFERNRSDYYDNLMRVREKNDLTLWFKFFLTGVIETAKKGVSTFDNILKLQKRVEDKINSLGSRAGNTKKVINYLYEHPMIDAGKIAEITGLSRVTSYKIVEELETKQILKEVTGGKRGKLYIFREYLNLFST